MFYVQIANLTCQFFQKNKLNHSYRSLQNISLILLAFNILTAIFYGAITWFWLLIITWKGSTGQMTSDL